MVCNEVTVFKSKMNPLSHYMHCPVINLPSSLPSLSPSLTHMRTRACAHTHTNKPLIFEISAIHLCQSPLIDQNSCKTPYAFGFKIQMVRSSSNNSPNTAPTRRVLLSTKVKAIWEEAIGGATDSVSQSIIGTFKDTYLCIGWNQTEEGCHWPMLSAKSKRNDSSDDKSNVHLYVKCCSSCQP